MTRIERYIERLQDSGDATKVMLAQVIQVQGAMLAQNPEAAEQVIDDLFREWQLTEEVKP